MKTLLVIASVLLAVSALVPRVGAEDCSSGGVLNVDVHCSHTDQRMHTSHCQVYIHENADGDGAHEANACLYCALPTVGITIPTSCEDLWDLVTVLRP
jgi:hypothetical protein